MGLKSKERPRCPFQHIDCFAYMNGSKCFCLDNTKFPKGKECPFYKSNPDDYDPKFLMKKYKEELENE